jgi:hypothetical protein
MSGEAFKKSVNQILKSDYGITLEDAGVEDEWDWDDEAAAITPIEWVQWYAEKYGLLDDYIL